MSIYFLPISLCFCINMSTVLYSYFLPCHALSPLLPFVSPFSHIKRVQPEPMLPDLTLCTSTFLNYLHYLVSFFSLLSLNMKSNVYLNYFTLFFYTPTLLYLQASVCNFSLLCFADYENIFHDFLFYISKCNHFASSHHPFPSLSPYIEQSCESLL